MSAVLITRTRTAWTQAIVMVFVFIVATLLIYRESAVAMVEIWSRSGTFAHCFLVPPISAWLIWRRRADIVVQTPAPMPWLLLPLAVAGLLWLVGDLAVVNAVSQFMLVTLIVLLVPAFVGWPATRTMLFPLCFLFFAVPIGEFMTPWLMERTADFTVFALVTTGIPVYREGQQFIIPSGSWSVVEACGGVRYLIASLMVGTLFAFLNYHSMRRRWIFMGVALILPIVANWLRAYFIVLIGHYSGNTLAVGVDHLIYGWLFFGVVILLMFMIGARWAEPDVKPTVALDLAFPATAGDVARVGWIMPAAVALVLALPVMTQRALIAQESHAAPRLGDPVLSATGWRVVNPVVLWTPAYDNPSAKLQRSYRADGPATSSFVGLHVAYFRQQAYDRKLVSSINQLARSDDHLWVVADVANQAVAYTWADELNVKTAHLRRPIGHSDSTRLVVWQLYWVNGRFTASDNLAKVYGALYRLLGQGDDGAAIFFYAAETQPGAADALLQRFVRDNLGAVETQLKRTRDSG